ncbi:MAG: matrixin family metalloprotease [bacterium]
MKQFIIFLILVILVASASWAMAAKPEFRAAKVTNPVTGEVKNSIVLPAKAIEVAPNIYDLGFAADQGRLVKGYAIVHKDKAAKPDTSCGNGICEPGENARKCPADCNGGEDPEPDTSSCYTFLAKSAKWKTVEPYLVNPANTEGLAENFVAANLAADIAKWEQAAAADILGQGSVTSAILIADTVATDGQNEVYFADIEEPGVIGVTIIWGIFGGPPFARELVEWDQVYNQADYDWSATGEANKMDFENIATHELGHSVGMGDLYNTDCSSATMYGYAGYGETDKRSLEAGDIAGISKLY